MTFKGSTLSCYIINQGAKGKENPFLDSMIVRGTNGIYEPFVNRFTGRGGIMDWGRTGLDPKKNYAEITDYKVTLKQTKLECDSVLAYTEYYEEPLYGDFKDIAKKYDRDIDRVYPNFTSFSKEVIREEILPAVDYIGGFAIEGADFAGIGFDKKPAMLIFKVDGKPFVQAKALSFKINDKGASATDCSVVMHLTEDDTISHPGLNLKYFSGETPVMELMRADKGLAQAPFKDSYHQLDMYVDRIIWTYGDPNLNLTWHRNSPKKIARFESQNYYSERIYGQIQGMNKVHPLVAIYNYSYKYDLQVIPVSKIAGPMGFTNDQAIPILLRLANQGFITYSTSRKEITVQPKTKKYIAARAGKIDYDHIVFTCNLLELEKRDEVGPDGRTDKKAVEYNLKADTLNTRKGLVPNFGYYNMRSFDLSLNEVDPIEISPLQKVVIFPSAGELLVKKNLDFVFEGAVLAGKLEVYLNEGSFDYDKFRINLIEVDAALFRVRPIYGGATGLVPMYSHFEGIKGYIEIDDPENRAGKESKSSAHYPVITSKKDSYVFYDHDYVYDGVYDSADFYFKVDPFVFDSLDNFDDISMSFDGEFRSAGIFPIFREKLRVQEDYSFGFKTTAPEGGLDFYGDYAKFDNEIRLSNEGLRGSGQIDFMTSTSISEDFVFFPDSTMGMSKYTNRPQTKSQGVSVPDVEGEGVMVTFVPKENILKARAVQSPL